VTQWIDSSSFDAVINCAAYTAVDDAEKNALRAHLVNGVGAGNVAQACSRVSIPTVFVSTDYVFDGAKLGPYDEDDTPNPQGVYGRSKLEGERATLTANPQSLVLRVSWVFSAQGRNFVKTMVSLAAQRDELRVIDDQRGSPCGAKSIADALLRITRQLLETGEGYGVYHFANSPYVSWHEFAVEIVSMLRARDMIVGEITVHPIATEQYPTAAKRPANSCLAASRIEADFGIDQPDWRIELAETIDALRRSS
jgi:dTDP-4-dehydrorhamnose reductase